MMDLLLRLVALVGGVKVAWGFGYSSSTSGDFESTTFVPYYNYEGELAVSGEIAGSVSGTEVTFSYALSGLDPACADGAGDAANSCGVHFHFARTCSGDGLGHFFTGDVTEDPWTMVYYSGTDTAGEYTVDVGATLAELESDWWPLAFVVHAYDGSRIACALLVSSYDAPIATGFVPYFNYEGDFEVSGHVEIASDGTTQTGVFDISGADPLCVDGRDVDTANSCGVHIHSGATCIDDALGHFYTGDVTEDPWLTVDYQADDTGAASGTFSVDTGASEEDILGKAFVIHAYDGSRIACAIIQ